MNNYVRFVLILGVTFLVSLISVGESHAYYEFEDCQIRAREDEPEGLQKVAYVSEQGHFAMALSEQVNFEYGLFCDDRLVINRSDNHRVFWLSDPGGMGHVSFSNEDTSFNLMAEFGFTEQSNCRITSESCDANDREVCILRVGNTFQSHVADCDNDVPFENNFQYKICCTPTEYCRDGIDNTGNNLIDCADPECHSTIGVLEIKECTPNPDHWDEALSFHQTTNNCVSSFNKYSNDLEEINYVDDCKDSDSNVYYCSYGGVYDGVHDYASRGACCPKGYYSNNLGGNNWECLPFEDDCGIASDTPCPFNFFVNENSWKRKLFWGNTSDYCHTAIPLLRARGVSDKSEVCCPVKGLGTAKYLILDENIKIFGYE